jgi:cholesterol transport system auxiliary component
MTPRTMLTKGARFVLLYLYCSLCGCALTSKADVVPIRYFSPERLSPPAPPSAPSAMPRELKLGRVSSGSNLRERIAYRQARYELGYYDDLRWTEKPETYVRRAMGQSLFESGRFRRALHGPAPTLDVEVLAFDDLRLDGRRAAHVAFKFVLYDSVGVRLERTVAEEIRVNEPEPRIEDVVEGMSQALERAVSKVVASVDEWFQNTTTAQQGNASATSEQPSSSAPDLTSRTLGVPNDEN